jgi:hypothetical protein
MSLAQDLQLFMSVPRAASFAVTFRLGTSQRLSLPGLSVGEQVIDELVECLELYARKEDQQLRDCIPDEAYYRNFLSLAQNIEPDGHKIDLVGFTTVRGGAPRRVQLTRIAPEAPAVRDGLQLVPPERQTPEEDTVEVTDTLKFADSSTRTNEIQVISPGNVRHTILVPPGMMSDIVKPLWEEEVTVTGAQKGKKIQLMQIRPVESD